jgi:hypothetical protein
MNNWTKNEFLAFLMLYACEANASAEQKECQWIRTKVGEPAFDEAYAAFKSSSDFEIINSITALKERFYPGESGKGEIHRHLVELFQSDGRFTAMEQHVVHELEKLF